MMALLVAVSVWATLRGWRMGLRIDDQGVTIRNFNRTYQLGWNEVSHFRDGAGLKKGTTPQWALSVVLQDGEAIVAYATSWSAETQAALEQAAQRHGISAELTGAIPQSTSRLQPR